MRSKYSSERTPSLVLPVDVSSPRAQTVWHVAAKIDTGAEVTIIPDSVRRGLNLKARGRLRTKGPFDAGWQSRPTYNVHLSIKDCISLEIKVLSAPRRHCLIGRDLLNRLVLHADGPAGEFELSV